MDLKKFTVNACCGKTTTIYQTSKKLSKSMITDLVAKGFKENERFSKNNVLYLESDVFFLTGPVGSNRLQVKCKKGDCSAYQKDLEETLKLL